MQDIESLRYKALEWIYAKAGGSQDEVVTLGDFMAEEGISLGATLGLVRELASLGLVNDASGMANPSAFLTPTGAQEVQGRMKRRGDPVLRRAAARNGLLRWFYKQDVNGIHMPVTGKVLDAEESLFEGERLTADEIDQAAEFLAGRGLIKGAGSFGSRGPVRAKITPEGQDCVEHNGGDVSDYLRERRTGAASISTHIGTINSSGALAVGSTEVSQNVTMGTDPAALAEFARTLMAELRELPLPADTAEEARSALQEVAEAGEDTAKAATAFRRFVGYLVDAGKPMVTAAFMIAARQYGLPSA
ncbi:hypothetical protein [Micromonospora carbonacea]|uniref:hypothetical protein n=1 Tax=Micromonospora carbonacea TaxID=47853 RepID=UPI0033C81292